MAFLPEIKTDDILLVNTPELAVILLAFITIVEMLEVKSPVAAATLLALKARVDNLAAVTLLAFITIVEILEVKSPVAAVTLLVFITIVDIVPTAPIDDTSSCGALIVSNTYTELLTIIASVT